MVKDLLDWPVEEEEKLRRSRKASFRTDRTKETVRQAPVQTSGPPSFVNKSTSQGKKTIAMVGSCYKAVTRLLQGFV